MNTYLHQLPDGHIETRYSVLEMAYVVIGRRDLAKLRNEIEAHKANPSEFMKQHFEYLINCRDAGIGGRYPGKSFKVSETMFAKAEANLGGATEFAEFMGRTTDMELAEVDREMGTGDYSPYAVLSWYDNRHTAYQSMQGMISSGWVDVQIELVNDGVRPEIAHRRIS